MQEPKISLWSAFWAGGEFPPGDSKAAAVAVFVEACKQEGQEVPKTVWLRGYAKELPAIEPEFSISQIVAHLAEEYGCNVTVTQDMLDAEKKLHDLILNGCTKGGGYQAVTEVLVNI